MLIKIKGEIKMIKKILITITLFIAMNTLLFGISEYHKKQYYQFMKENKSETQTFVIGFDNIYSYYEVQELGEWVTIQLNKEGFEIVNMIEVDSSTILLYVRKKR